MRRYRPFSHINLLHDEPLLRCGSSLLLFLEPRSDPVRPAEQPAARKADHTDPADSAPASSTAEEMKG